MLKHKAWKLIGLLILAFIISRIDWSRFTIILRRAKVGWFVIAFFLNIPQLWLKATRWQNLLSAQKKVIRNWDAFLYYFSATFLGVITPGRLGEFAKVVYLKNDGIADLSFGFSSVLIDRLWDLSLLTAVGLLGVVILRPWPYAEAVGGAALILYICFIAYFMWPKGLERISGILYQKLLASKIPDSAKGGARQFREGLLLVLGKKIGISACLTVLAYGLFFLQCYLITKCFGIPLGYFQIAMVMSMVNLFSFIPITVSGLGTRDAALLFLLGQKGISYETIMAFSMGIFAVFYLGGGLLGVVAWFLKPIDLKGIKQKAFRNSI